MITLAAIRLMLHRLAHPNRMCLPKPQGKRSEAHDLLAPVYG
jgi:hypothetical protein